MKVDGTMCSGNFDFRKPRRTLTVGRGSFRGTTYATNRLSPCTSSRATTTGLLHGGVLAQDGLDLAQLDAEAADLDLVVKAAAELDVAVG